MANDTRKLDPVALSELDRIEDARGFWIFGSKENEDGTLVSGKCKFDTLEKLQLERRLTLTMENNKMDIFIGEEMTIYKVDALNVNSLSIEGEEFTNINDTLFNKKVGKGLVEFVITPQLTDSTAYLFIYAKAELP